MKKTKNGFEWRENISYLLQIDRELEGEKKPREKPVKFNRLSGIEGN